MFRFDSPACAAGGGGAVTSAVNSSASDRASPPPPSCCAFFRCCASRWFRSCFCSFLGTGPQPPFCLPPPPAAQPRSLSPHGGGDCWLGPGGRPAVHPVASPPFRFWWGTPRTGLNGRSQPPRGVGLDTQRPPPQEDSLFHNQGLKAALLSPPGSADWEQKEPCPAPGTADPPMTVHMEGGQRRQVQFQAA